MYYSTPYRTDITHGLIYLFFPVIFETKSLACCLKFPVVSLNLSVALWPEPEVALFTLSPSPLVALLKESLALLAALLNWSEMLLNGFCPSVCLEDLVSVFCG